MTKSYINYRGFDIDIENNMTGIRYAQAKALACLRNYINSDEMMEHDSNGDYVYFYFSVTNLGCGMNGVDVNIFSSIESSPIHNGYSLGSFLN